MKKQIEDLQGKILIAMPHLKDTFFAQTVCYICQHDSEGTLAFVINKPVSMQEGDLLLDQNLNVVATEFSRPLLEGGPIHPDRGFVIHTQKGPWKNTLTIGKELYVSTSQQILSAIADKKVKGNYLIVLGYASWEPNQLSAELLENDWLVGEASAELLFEIPFEQRWLFAIQQMGIQNPFYLTGISGNA